MRNVEHLMGVEFIHDLYNRHEPKINSIRFRNTITIWKDGIVNSYAPAHEWEKLSDFLGYQYYSLNSLIIEQTKILYRRKRKEFHAFIKLLEKTDLKSLPDIDIASLLINFQSIVLGELYVLNFVQIEHSLNAAIKKLIAELIPDKERVEQIFIKLIQTEIPTASQKEKMKLHSIARKWKILKKFSLYKETMVDNDLKKHADKYGYLYSAYGESPRNFNEFKSTFMDYIENRQAPPKIAIFPRLLNKEVRQTLAKINNRKLDTLVTLIVSGGIFRDTNKALLGMSVKYRFLILDEIARRGLEARGNLDFYLLSEIASLLCNSKKLEDTEISSRKKNGIVLTRSEGFREYAEDILPIDKVEEHKNIIRGQCASRGKCSGKCKIVLTKEDVNKVENGDIMVAIGTDFDLIEAMYRSAAVITEEGGILSHASVVCRELNKPCCIGVKDATRILRDNQILEVDATKGEVIVSE